MEENWVKVFSTDQKHLAEIVKSVLHENGIEAVEIEKKDSSFLIGDIELYTHIKEAEKAQHLIEKNNL